MNEIRRILIFFFLLLCLSSCKSALERQDSEQYYFLTTQTFDEWQVWKVAVDGSGEEMIYSIPLWTAGRTSSGMVIFDEAIYDNEIGRQLMLAHSQAGILTQFETYLNISVSPNNQYIAYDESYSICSGNLCDGLYVIRIIGLESGVEMMRYLSSEPMSVQDWSPDSKYLVFQQLDDYYRAFTDTVHVWDIANNREIMAFEGEASEFIGDSSTILARSYIKDENGWTTQKECCQLADVKNQKIEILLLPKIKAYFETAISHDGSQFAIVHHQDGFYAVKVFDLEKEKDDLSFSPYITTSAISSPDWSYDDQLIAFKSYRNGISSLNIIDRDMGETLMKIPGVQTWDWSEYSNRIIYISDDEPNNNSCAQQNAKINIYDVDSGETQRLKIPVDVSEFMDKNQDTLICIQFLQNVDW